MKPRRLSALAATVATGAWLSSLTASGIALRPTSAEAFPNPCMSPQGYLIICCPKPCPVLDTQKLGTEVTKLSTEMQKLTSLMQQLQQWQSALKAIGNPSALLSMLGGGGSSGGSDVRAFQGLTAPNASGGLAGANFDTVGGSKNAIAQMFFNPQNTGNSDRIVAATDAKVNAMATGLHARNKVDSGMDDINKIVEDAKKTKTTRDETAIANRIRLAMLQILKNQSTLQGSMLEMFGSSSALSLGPESSGQGAYSGATTPYAPAQSAAPAKTSDQAALHLAAASAAMNSAVDIHNAVAAAAEMNTATRDASAILNEQNAVNAAAAQARAALVSALSGLYSDPSAAADALLAAAIPNITAPWPDSFTRTSQESAAAQNALQTIASAPDTYGAAMCRMHCGTDGTSLSSAIYAALDSGQQAAWYTTLTNNADELRQTIASETAALSQSVGVDVTNPAAATAAIAAQTAAANTALTNFRADVSTTDQKTSAATIATTLDVLSQDPGFSHYIAYDSSVAPTPTAAQLLVAN